MPIGFAERAAFTNHWPAANTLDAPEATSMAACFAPTAMVLAVSRPCRMAKTPFSPPSDAT